MRTLYLASLMAVSALLPTSPCLLAAEESDGTPWPTVSKPVVIGCVAMQLTNQELHVACSNWKIALECPLPSIQDYVCAVRQPLAQPRFEDGFVKSDGNFREIKYVEDFKASAFPRFAFFTNRPITIGLLTGHAAANGASMQKLLLVDVETGAHVVIPLVQGQMPQWLDRTNHPPAFATRHRSNGTAGADLRVGQVFRFQSGQYRRDLATEQQMLLAGFQKAQLTAAQRKELREAGADILDTDFSSAGRPLDNFIYYGTRSGNGKAVDALLATLPPELRTSAKERQAEIIKESQRDDLEEAARSSRGDEALTGIAESGNKTAENSQSLLTSAATGVGELEVKPPLSLAPWTVQAGDTGAALAKRFGSTIKQLQAANPHANWKRLQVGQTLLIPGYGWHLLESTANHALLATNCQSGLAVSLVNENDNANGDLKSISGSAPELIHWQQERDQLWSLTYLAGAPGKFPPFDIVRKALINRRTRQLVADVVFQYQTENHGFLPASPTWTWTTNALIITDPLKDNAPPVRISISVMQ